MISRTMRDVLIDHLDCRAVPILRPSDSSGQDARDRSVRHSVTEALIVRGLLRTDHRYKPQTTIMTEAGRAALAAVLADWAEAIVKAQFKAEEPEVSLRWRPRASTT